MSITPVETWVGADLSQIGPIYPMVGSEMLLVIIGFIIWLGFHYLQIKVEKREMKADAEAARSPEILARVFEDEETV